MGDLFAGVPTPFLGLRARLSQVWVAPGVLVLVLYIVKLLLLKKTILAALRLIEEGVVVACRAYEASVADALAASRQSAELANQLAELALQHAVAGIREALAALVTMVEQIVIFMIELTVGTWACLSVTLFRALAEGALSVVEDAISIINEGITAVIDKAEEGLQGLSKLINGATGLVGTIESFITGSQDQIHKVNLTISGLHNFTIPDSVTTRIDLWKKEVPDYDQVRDDVRAVFDIPFQLIRREIVNSTGLQPPRLLANITAPSAAQVRGCNFSDIGKAFGLCVRAVKVTVNGLCIAIGCCILVLLAYEVHKEWRKWTRLQKAVADLEGLAGGEPHMYRTVERLDVLTGATEAGLQHRLVQTVARQPGGVLKVWYVRYLLSPNSLAVLLLGLAGLLVTLLEWAVVLMFKHAAKSAQSLLHSMPTDLRGQVHQDAAAWRTAVNSAVATSQNNINTQLFGWASRGTQAVNDTLTHFMGTINGVLTASMGNSTLHDLAAGVVDCTIGRKVAAVEAGLTWVHDRAHVSFPQIPPNMTWAAATNASSNSTLGRIDVQFETQLHRLAQNIEDQLRVQAWVSGAFLLAWVLLATAPLVYSCYANRYVYDQDVTIVPLPDAASNHTATKRHRVGQALVDAWHYARASRPKDVEMYFSNS